MIEGEALARFIVANLPLTPARAVPEVLLHLARPTSGLHRLGLKRSPYWAYQWAGGTALARYILDRPEAVAGRRVLDIGCGGGLVAIAAAMAGAREVSAVDIDAAAVTATRLAAAANGVELVVSCADALAEEPPDVDLLLAGDLFYAPRLAASAKAFFTCCSAASLDVIIGDPGRAPLPLDRLTKLADALVPDFGDRAGNPCSGAVYVFNASSAYRLAASEPPSPHHGLRGHDG